jgi:hypothetical protein
VARLAAGMGAMGLTRRRPQCVHAASCVVLTCSLPTVERYWSEIPL